MNTKNAVFCGALLGLVAPYVFAIFKYAHGAGRLVAESSIYSLDRHLYFGGFIRDGSLFFSGQHSVFLASYFVFYALWSCLGTAFSDTTSYFLLLIAFTTFGLYYFVRLLLTVGEQPGGSTTQQWIVACGLGVLYFSSLSLFNYLKSNVLFALPYWILPSLLYFALIFVTTGDKRRLIVLLFLSLILTDFNLAHTLILVAFLNVFLLASWKRHILPARQLAIRVSLVNIVLAPACCLLAIVALENALYSGSMSAFTKSAAENMYSNNARYLNILLQLTDWGLFGSWRGSPYYAFSSYYSKPQVEALGLVQYVLLVFSVIVTNAEKTQRKFAASLLLIGVFIIQLMLGDNNPLYRFLYHHVSAFQVLRNITKLAPLLELTVLFSIYIFIRGRLNRRRYFWTIIVSVAIALVFNMPYWTYGGTFFENRAIGSIPAYWGAASGYLSRNLSPYSNILTLPAIYVNDVYDWNGRYAWVQGSLLDIAAMSHSYRLSECCIGSLQFQQDARSVFEPSARSVRGLDVNYSRLTALVKRHHLDYVVVSADLLSEYQDLGDIYRWLRRAGYTLRATFGPISIYENPLNLATPVSGGTLKFQEINPLRYRIYISHLRVTQTIELSEPYNAGWTALADVKPSDTWCAPTRRVIRERSATPCGTGKETFWDELMALPRTSALAAAHKASVSGGNEWTLSREYIKQALPADAYRINTDGSIDIELELYFRPQGYFFLVLFICGFTFLALLMLLCWASLRRKVVRDSAQAAMLVVMTIFVFAVAVVIKESSGPVVDRLASPGAGGLLKGAFIVPTAAITFRHPNAAPRSLHLSLFQRRGHRHAASQWKVFGCNNVVRPFWSTSSIASESIDVDIAPEAGGGCLLHISAFVPGEGEATEAIPVTVMGPMSWSPKRYEPRISRDIPSNDAPPEILTLRKENDIRGLSPVLLDDSCGRVARVHPEDGLPLRDGSGASEARVTLQPIAPGVCTAVLRDRYAEAEALPVALNLHVMGALSLAPDRKQTSADVRLKGLGNASARIVLYKSFDSEPIALRFGTNGCAQVAGFYVTSRSTPRKPVLQPATAAITVVPVKIGRCKSTFLDQYGAKDTIVTIRVVVGK